MSADQNSTINPIWREPKMALPLPVCRVCDQPGYCRAHAECSYTKTPMIDPDGTRRWREIAKDHPR